MAYEIVDPTDFLSDGAFFEDRFVAGLEQFDWDQFDQKQVLVRGCNSAIMPPWAFMAITGKLAGIARSVRYGNEHDNIVVYRAKRAPKE